VRTSTILDHPGGIAAIVLAILIVAACGGDEPSDPAATGPVVDCIGVPAAHCREAVDQALADAGGSRVVAITIRCSAPSCTLQQGQTEVTVLLADGRQITSGTGWAAAAPAPAENVEIPLPVRPTCAGVPLKACEQFATDSVQHLGRPVDTVVSILVRCAAATPCLETTGSGSTDVTFRDGTHQTSEWVYEGAIGP
jgi:hypothetical protein